MNAFLAIPESDPRVREKLNPAIFVEQTDRDPASEDTRQTEFVAGIRKNSKALRVFAIPNGAKRSQWEASKVKREGLYTGWPDTGLCWANSASGAVAWIEFKNGTEGPSQDQIAVLNWLHERGFPVAVCRTAFGANRWLQLQGAPVEMGGLV